MSMNLDFKDKLLRKPMRGVVEFFDNNGNLLFTKENLILASTRFAILYNLFTDQKILSTAISEGYLRRPSNDKTDGYRPAICGFSFGCNGANISNPSILRVPSPNDQFDDISNLDNNTTNFIPVSFISINESDNNTNPTFINTGGSFQNLSEYINQPVVSDGVITETNNTNSTVKYFTPTYNGDISGNYYCKAINVYNSEINVDPDSYEIEYLIKFKVEPYDLIGKSFNELGLVVANCKFSDDNTRIIDVDSSTVVLGSRLTFEEISLSKQLLASFNVRYHLYI